MPLITSNVLGPSLLGLPVDLVADDDTQLVDDDGAVLIDDLAYYAQLLNLSDADNTLLVDDDGTQIVDDNPRTAMWPTVTQWLRAEGANLVLEDGTPFRFRGINWSGFESRMFPGLLTVRAYKSVVIDGVVQQGIIDQIAAAGFNSIRFPICEDMTWPNACGQYFDGINVALNPDLINYANYNGTDENANGNAVLPPLEILDSFIAHCKSLGIRILLDMHCAAPNTQNAAGFNGRWYTTTGPNGPAGTTMGLFTDPRSEQNLLNAWLVLAERYANEPTVAAFEIVNEPWDTTWDDDPITGLPAMYERVGNAIQEVNSNVLIICEGNLITPAQLPDYPSKYGTWPGWGQNLYNVHFRRVKLKLRQDKLCYAPHEYYGPSYQWTQDYSFPETMPEVWDTLWGWIIDRDIAPIVITEWGGNFSGVLPAQVKWANRMMEYFYLEKGGLVNWFHWAMVPGNGATDATQSVVGLINQQEGAGGSNTLWPDQLAMCQKYIEASQNS
jgi:endoglucanase